MGERGVFSSSSTEKRGDSARRDKQSLSVNGRSVVRGHISTNSCSRSSVKQLEMPKNNRYWKHSLSTMNLSKVLIPNTGPLRTSLFSRATYFENFVILTMTMKYAYI